MRRKLDLGCGAAKPGSDWVGLDVVDTSDADVVHDLTDTPYPFDDDRFEYVRAHNVLEHIPLDRLDDVMREVARISRLGATVEITGPHYLHRNTAAADHYQGFSEATFNVYTVGHEYPTDKPQKFRLRTVEYVWTDRFYLNVVRRLLPKTLVRKHIPNTVDEIAFQLEVVK